MAHFCRLLHHGMYSFSPNLAIGRSFRIQHVDDNKKGAMHMQEFIFDRVRAKTMLTEENSGSLIYKSRHSTNGSCPMAGTSDPILCTIMI